MAVTIEVLLKAVSIKENGEDGVTTAATLLTTSLAYRTPRPHRCRRSRV